MKKTILLFTVILITVMANATIINVDNSPNRPSGYQSNLQVAINNASVGDTLYVYASNTTYGNITIKKRLYLFGAGYRGGSGSESQMHHLYLDTATSPASNPSGSTIQGFKISKVYCNKPNIVNIVFAGNYFSSYIYLNSNCSGWLFTNNYFGNYITIYNNNNIIITNNIFNNTYAIQSSNSSSVFISHNLFMKWSYFQSVYNATISDNIFVCNGATNISYMARNNFINNISWRTTLAPYVLPPEGNSGSGNISNQDPQFETALSSGNFDYTKDYHLKTASPGTNAATDGSNIGPYGGSSPFVWGGAFTIPKITLTNITNPVINQSTPINVNVKANKAKL